MRRFCLLFVCCLFPAAAVADDNKNKPILVLDAGGHTAMVKKVLFTPDGKELVTVSDDKTIRTWDVETGEPLGTLRPPIGRGPVGMHFAAALSRDGKRLAVGGYGSPTDDYGTILLIALPSGRIEKVLKGHTKVIHGLAFSHDGKRLISGSGDQTARIWDVASGKSEQTLKGHTDYIYGVCFSPDGRHVATACFDKTARIWFVATGKAAAVLRGHTRKVRCIAWSPDGKTLATGSNDESICLWDADGTFRKQFRELGNYISSITFAANSRRLLYTTGGPGKRDIATLLDLASGREQVCFTQHTNTILHGSLSTDGTLAASSGGDDHEVYVWKTGDGAVVSRLASRGRATRAAAWAKHGKTIAWGNTNNGNDTFNATIPLERTFHLDKLEFGQAPDSSFRRARLRLGLTSLVSTAANTAAVKRADETVAEVKLANRYEEIRCYTLLPSGRVAVGTDFGLYLFSTATGKQIRQFHGHTGVVWAVAPSPDNRYLLSASNDMTLRVWDVEHDEPLLSLFFAGNDWIAWTPEGYYAASTGGEKLMGWHVNNGPDKMASFHAADKFRASLYRPDVIKLLLAAGSVEKALALADEARGKKTEPTEISKVLPPRVVITSPTKSGVRLDKAEVEVQATATSRGTHPVTALRLLLDGRPYQGQAGVKTLRSPRLGEVKASWTVKLTLGKNRLSVQAESAVSKAVSDEVTVVYVGERETKVELPRLYVLAVGVSAYRGNLKLNYAARDAQAIAKVFEDHSKPLYRGIEVKLLTDKEATRAGILKGLTWLRRQMTQRDVAVFFFAGHGQKDSDSNFYLLPVDVDTTDLLASGVGDSDVKKALGGMPGRVLTLLDACHAGAVGGGKRRAASSLTDDLMRDLVTEDYGVVVMASAMGREFALESNSHRHGCFTQALVEGLSGKAKKSLSGAIYLHHLDAYVTDRVKELTEGQQHPVTAKPSSVRSFPLARP